MVKNSSFRNFIDIHAESDAMKANFLEQMSDMKVRFISQNNLVKNT